MNFIIEIIFVMGLLWVAIPAVSGFTEGLRQKSPIIQNNTAPCDDITILPQKYSNVVLDVKSAMKNMGFKKDTIDRAIIEAMKEDNGITIDSLLRVALRKAI